MNSRVLVFGALFLGAWTVAAQATDGKVSLDAVVTKTTGHCTIVRNGKTEWTDRCRDGKPLRDEPADAPVVIPDTNCGTDGDQAILATIREMESGDYGKAPNAGGASGAYQFVQGTWNSTATRAGRKDLVGRGPWTVSPADQDAMALQHVHQAMALGGVQVVPMIWYLGHIPEGHEWDVVPHPEAGNKITPRQYRDRWMKVYERTGAPCGERA